VEHSNVLYSSSSRLFVLPTNVIPSKNFPGINTLAYFARAAPIIMKKECFLALAPSVNCRKLFSSSLIVGENKLEFCA
jgi:hypothetical protein